MDDKSFRPLLDIKKCKFKVNINKQRYREFCFLLQKSGGVTGKRRGLMDDLDDPLTRAF